MKMAITTVLVYYNVLTAIIPLK